MRAFAEAWPDATAIGQQAVGQLPWRHNVVLLTKLKARELRLQYAEAAVTHGWSRNVLVRTSLLTSLVSTPACSSACVQSLLTMDAPPKPRRRARRAREGPQGSVDRRNLQWRVGSMNESTGPTEAGPVHRCRPACRSGLDRCGLSPQRITRRTGSPRRSWLAQPRYERSPWRSRQSGTRTAGSSRENAGPHSDRAWLRVRIR